MDGAVEEPSKDPSLVQMSSVLRYGRTEATDDVTVSDEQAIANHQRVIIRRRYRRAAGESVLPGLGLWMMRSFISNPLIFRLRYGQQYSSPLKLVKSGKRINLMDLI